MPDVFISYNREDRETARTISTALEAEGFSVWWDAALRAGETYDEVTEQNLRQAGAVVVLWSKRSANSKWVRAEATVGERSSTLVPALIEDCERPIRFELVQTADLRHWRGDRADPNWRAFIQDIRTAISKKAPRTSASPAPAMTSTDVSIEQTFWNSIKDGQERSDFEAYLARYPAGHFAALAKNRLAALNRPAAPPPPPRPAASAPFQPQPRQQPAQPQRPAAPQPRAVAPAPEQKSGGGALVIGAFVAALAAAGAAAFMLMRGDEPAAVETAAVEPSPAIVAEALPEPEAPAEPESAPATDMLSEASGAVPPATAPDAAAAMVEPAPPESAPTAEPPQASPSGPFRDCDACPQMVRLPGGTYLRGSPEDEAGRNAYEGPQREVTVGAFAIGAYEVTREEWNACAADGACPDKGYSVDGSMPALGVSFREGEQFTRWLSKKTGKRYRIPTEAEWEYAARGGTQTAYWWGQRYEPGRAATGAPAKVGSHAPNGFGLYDVTGNAREWVADCYVNNYVNAPDDGGAVTAGDCSKRVVRGGAWTNPPVDLRIANRSRIDAGVRAQYMGLRVAADLD